MINLLIVDDEPIVVEGLAFGINWEELGVLDVYKAYSPKQAAEYIEKYPVDIIITDYNMPDCTGVQLTKILKEKNPRAKSILISAYDEFKYAKEAIETGVFRYILKPIDYDEVRTAIGELIGIINASISHQSYVAGLESKIAAEVESQESSSLIGQAKKLVKPEQEVTLTAIAAKLFVHPNYLSRLFKENAGITFSDYVIKVKMNRAKELLKNRELKIYEIAERVGYLSVPCFNTTFKKITGITPREYRERD